MSTTATTTTSSLPEFKSLSEPPTDGITSLCYLPPSSSVDSNNNSNLLLASTSWDGRLRIHDTTAGSCVTSELMDSGPLLSLTTTTTIDNNGAASTILITGGLDGSIRKFDVSSSTSDIIGTHSGNSSNNDESQQQKVACSCLSSLKDDNMIASAGWDGMFHLWNIKNPPGSPPIKSIKLPGKAYSMDYDSNYNRLVIATSGRQNCFIDIKTNDGGVGVDATLVLQRESSLKYQTRCIKFFPNGRAITLGSIEGRVAVEYIDDLLPEGDKTNKKKYAFKCHRVDDSVYPVNDITFHPTYGTFATAGCDGTVIMWDGINKKKLCNLTQSQKMNTSISCIVFAPTGSNEELAIASSYTFEEGERDFHPRDEIFIRKLNDSECKPKS